MQWILKEELGSGKETIYNQAIVWPSICVSPLIFLLPTILASNISKYKHEIFWIRQHRCRGTVTAAHPSVQNPGPCKKGATGLLLPWSHCASQPLSAPFSLWLGMGGTKLKPEPTFQPQDLQPSCRACSKFTWAHIFLTSPAGAGTLKRLFINSSRTNEQERKQIHL